jgi:membrane protein DedA with SNARE-associated domain
MPTRELALLQTFLGHFTYAALFAVLVGAGVGLPFPEEATQLTAGFLAHQGLLSYWPALGVTWTGIVLGDLLLYRLGRRHGERFLASPRVARFFTPERRRWVERHFASHDFLTIAAARHASGLRLPVFATAGAMGVPLRTFVLADGLSALVSVPLVVSLGYLFSSQLEQLKRHLHQAQLLGLLLLAALAAVTVLVKARRRRGARTAGRPGDDAG